MATKKIKKRIKLSDAQLKSEILSLFNSGKTGKTDLYGVIRIKYTLSRGRYFKAYDQCYAEWVKINEQATIEASVQSAKESAQMGLKSKLDRQMLLQKQIDDIQAEIDRGILEEYAYISGKYKKVDKVMNAETKAQLRKTMKDLVAELNKMDGAYAPTKLFHQGELTQKLLNVDPLSNIEDADNNSTS